MYSCWQGQPACRGKGAAQSCTSTQEPPVCSQDCQRRTGLLGLSADITSPGLQALVCLYYSTPQCLGYIYPSLPTSFQLPNGLLVEPKGRLTPPFSSSSISSRAADVFRGSIGKRLVVMKTSACIDKQVNAQICIVHTCICIAVR